MKKDKYKVMFEGVDQFVHVYAGSIEQAEILAQAERINEGKNYRVAQTIKVEKATDW